MKERALPCCVNSDVWRHPRRKVLFRSHQEGSETRSKPPLPSLRVEISPNLRVPTSCWRICKRAWILCFLLLGVPLFERKPVPTDDDLKRLGKENLRTASMLPNCAWSGLYHSAHKIRAENFQTLEDKAIGWSFHRFRGKGGVIQTDPEKIEEVAEGFLLHEFHQKTPDEMVDLGLMDPVPLFVKNDGHPAKKQEIKRWRLIWNVSQIDTSIEMYLRTTLNTKTVTAYQDGLLNTIAIGCGHHDVGIKTTSETTDMVKEFNKLEQGGGNGSPDSAVHFLSDASGWDLSVTSYTASSTTNIRALKANTDYEELLQVNEGYFTFHHVLHDGEAFYELCRLGKTSSGRYPTGWDNSKDRSTTARSVQPEELVDKALVEVIVRQPAQLVIAQLILFNTYLENSLIGFFRPKPGQTKDTVSSVGGGFLGAYKNCVEYLEGNGTLPDKEVAQNGLDFLADSISHHYAKVDGEYSPFTKILTRCSTELLPWQKDKRHWVQGHQFSLARIHSWTIVCCQTRRSSDSCTQSVCTPVGLSRWASCGCERGRLLDC